MNDIEDRLKRLRPLSPPQTLRNEVIRAIARGRSPRRAHDWLLPAAAAIAIVVLSALARIERMPFWPREDNDPVRATIIQGLAEQLGGDALAAHRASQIVEQGSFNEVRVE